MKTAEFDAFANDYDEILNRAISLSGEDSRYFAEQRVAQVRSMLDTRGIRCRSVMDFGCGTGTAVGCLAECFQPDQIVGVDVSIASLKIAAQRHANKPDVSGTVVRFEAKEDYVADGGVDLVYCNGVLHHIDPRERAETFVWIRDALRSGGICAIWENNPWSLPARYCMKINPFDRHASMISAARTGELCRDAGMEVLSTRYAFVFPGWLAKCRWTEHYVARFPLGAQYVVLARKRFHPNPELTRGE